jgi:uncharacterized protein YjcR
MHGGTNRGAPKGNQNALKHGFYSAAEAERRREVTEDLKKYRTLLADFEKMT